MTLALDLPERPPLSRDQIAIRLRVGLIALLAGTALLALSTGPSGASLWRALAALASGSEVNAQDALVLWEIRLPRLILGALIGAGLATGGAVMQGVFRNPLADPGLVGVGAGAALGAVSMIVLGSLMPAGITALFGQHLVAIAAFLGGWVITLLLYRVATRAGRTSVSTLLLAGIALSALAGAVTGILIFVADDRALRDLTFWSLGSLAGASWVKVAVAAPLILAALVAAPFLGRGLNALALGEAAAMHMGVPVERLKRIAILSVAAATGAAVAVAGAIGFVGIVVPHLLRLMSGPDHRPLLVNAALLGASLLLLADTISRSIVAPAELPIGIITAAVGAPVFLWILLRQNSGVDL
jgi:iron complex transport system permease protein